MEDFIGYPYENNPPQPEPILAGVEHPGTTDRQRVQAKAAVDAFAVIEWPTMGRECANIYTAWLLS